MNKPPLVITLCLAIFWPQGACGPASKNTKPPRPKSQNQARPSPHGATHEDVETHNAAARKVFQALVSHLQKAERQKGEVSLLGILDSFLEKAEKTADYEPLGLKDLTIDKKCAGSGDLRVWLAPKALPLPGPTALLLVGPQKECGPNTRRGRDVGADPDAGPDTSNDDSASPGSAERTPQVPAVCSVALHPDAQGKLQLVIDAPKTDLKGDDEVANVKWAFHPERKPMATVSYHRTQLDCDDLSEESDRETEGTVLFRLHRGRYRPLAHFTMLEQERTSYSFHSRETSLFWERTGKAKRHVLVVVRDITQTTTPPGQRPSHYCKLSSSLLVFDKKKDALVSPPAAVSNALWKDPELQEYKKETHEGHSQSECMK